MEVFTNQQRYLRAARRVTSAYLLAVCFLFPLVFWQKFFDITEAKLAFFLGASALYLLSLVLLRLIFPRDFGVRREHIAPSPAVLAMAALFLIFCAGSALGGHPGDVFWGQNNRYQGLLTLFAYAAVLLALSQNAVELRLVERALALGAIPVCALGLLNHFGVDPLGFYTDLRSFDRGRFISTLGNADFYGSYLCIAFPAVLGWFTQAKLRRDRVLAAVSLACASFGVLVAGSDSTALGLLVAALLFPLFLFADTDSFRRLFAAGAVFSLCALVFGQLSRVLPSKTYLSAFMQTLACPAVSSALLALFVLLWFFLRRVRPARLQRLKKPYLITLLALATLVAAGLVLLNTALIDLPLGGAADYLRFSASWGTDRGKIWMFALRLYRSYSPLQKLFGAGPGALYYADAANRVFSDAALDTAHNEYLQYLLVSGAAGLCAYLLLVVFSVRSGLKKGEAQPGARALTIAVLAYCAQAAVNIAQPMSTPLLFVLLGALIARSPDTGELGAAAKPEAPPGDTNT